MKDRCYIVFDKSGIIKMYKNTPPIKPGEFYIAVDLSVPNSYFIEPLLKTTITLPEKTLDDSEIIAELKDDIKMVTGFVNPRITLTFLPEVGGNQE